MTSQEYVNLLSHLPNALNQIQNRLSLNVKVAFVKQPLNGSYQVIYDVDSYHNNISGGMTKKAEIEIVEFAINLSCSTPFWEPRVPIKIKEFNISSQDRYRFM